MRKQDVTYDYKLNELRLDFSHPKSIGKVFVLFEGESDIKLFRKLFNENNCKVETVPGGKLKLEECVGILGKIYPLIIGIRDADFVHLEAKPYEKANIFLTDYHDMEMTLVSDDEVFSSILSLFYIFPKNKHSEIRNNIMLSIEQIGYLKWLNEIEDLEYKFDAGFQKLISFDNFKIDFEQYFDRVLSKSPNAKITDKTIILEKIRVLKATNPDQLQLCNGHDFIKAFAEYLRINSVVKKVNDENIADSFIVSFHINHYIKTKLYLKTKMWADNRKCVIY